MDENMEGGVAGDSKALELEDGNKANGEQRLESDNACFKSKQSTIKGYPKLDDALQAGSETSMNCTLILTEGDSAKALVVAGLSIVGRELYGIYPLKGKLLNVRDASHSRIVKNVEIGALVEIIGLQYNSTYDTKESLMTLRYGRLMMMMDQDPDGSHIKGLIINFIHLNWPNLLKHHFLEEFITPLIKVSKNEGVKSFYSIPEFDEWKISTDRWQTWKVKYYKGLGTSTATEAKEYFTNFERHHISFKYTGPEDDAAIVLAFSKKKIEERKIWLSNWMENEKHRIEMDLPDDYLYKADTRSVSFKDFVNKELILFSLIDNRRSIPSAVDGLKPGQRKVIFASFKRDLVEEINVAQLAGSVAELTAYHHGEQSLTGTIINLAQDFVGSNNLNLMLPIGQFGTRHRNGKDAASARYLFTKLSLLARHVFNPHDDALLNHLKDDNLKIEPEYYIPIVPMVLINGAKGIGTGWSTKIPNFDVREIIKNLQLMIDGKEPLPMKPSYRQFKGTVEKVDEHRLVTSGEIFVSDEQVTITELPIGENTFRFKKLVLDKLMKSGSDFKIVSYKELHTDENVCFEIKMLAQHLSAAEHIGLHSVFRLQTLMSMRSMVLFNHEGCIKLYEDVQSILKDFFDIRFLFYQRRKQFLEKKLRAEVAKLSNQIRFVQEMIDANLSIGKKTKLEMCKLLADEGYQSDPVKAWQHEHEVLGEVSEGDFDYLLNQPFWALSTERQNELVQERTRKEEELGHLCGNTEASLWKNDLADLVSELDKVESLEGLKRLNVAGAAETTSPGRRIEPTFKAIRGVIEAAKNEQKSDAETDDALEALLNPVKDDSEEAEEEAEEGNRKDVKPVAEE